MPSITQFDLYDLGNLPINLTTTSCYRQTTQLSNSLSTLNALEVRTSNSLTHNIEYKLPKPQISIFQLTLVEYLTHDNLALIIFVNTLDNKLSKITRQNRYQDLYLVYLAYTSYK